LGFAKLNRFRSRQNDFASWIVIVGAATWDHALLAGNFVMVGVDGWKFDFWHLVQRATSISNASWKASFAFVAIHYVLMAQIRAKLTKVASHDYEFLQGRPSFVP
jgi:hypothetical protein